MDSAQPKNPQRDWDKVVQENKGMFHLPEQFKEAATSWQNERIKFQKEANQLAKKENEIALAFQRLIFEIREHLEEAGVENIWTMDIGFNTEALKEGKFIINVTQNPRQ